MPLPRVEHCFLPLLEVLADGEPVAEHAALLMAKRAGFGQLPSIDLIQTDKRGVPVIQRRITWAKFYLVAAGMIRHSSRDFIQLSGEGRAALERGSCTWQDLACTAQWTQKFGFGWLPPQAQHTEM